MVSRGELDKAGVGLAGVFFTEVWSFEAIVLRCSQGPEILVVEAELVSFRVDLKGVTD